MFWVHLLNYIFKIVCYDHEMDFNHDTRKFICICFFSFQNHLPGLCDHVRYADIDTDDSILSLKAALWALVSLKNTFFFSL